MPPSAMIELTPIYKPKLRGNSVLLELPTGRLELSKAWWKGCPNCCCAHLPGIFPTCREFCQPLRKSVGGLSRELLVLVVEHCRKGSSFRKRLAVSPNCRHKDVIHLTQTQESNSMKLTEAYDLSIGPSGHRPWMRFRIQWAPTLEDGTSSAVTTVKQKATKKSSGGWSCAESNVKQARRRTDLRCGEKKMPSNGFLVADNESSNIFKNRTLVPAGSKRKLFSDESWSKVDKGGRKHDKIDTGYYNYARLHRDLPLGQLSESSCGTDDDDSRVEPSHRKRTKVTTAQRQLMFFANSDSAESSESQNFRNSDLVRKAVDSSTDSPLNEYLQKPKPRKVTPQGKQMTAEEVVEEAFGAVNRKEYHEEKRPKRRRIARLLPVKTPEPARGLQVKRNELTTRQRTTESPTEDCVHDKGDKEGNSYEKEPGNSTQQPSLSYLSLPVQDSESMFSEDDPLSRLSNEAESTQMWGAPPNSTTNSNNSVASYGPLPPFVQRACDLKIAEWKALQRSESVRDAAKTGSFRLALINLVVFKNQEGDHSTRPLWLPPLLDDETLVHRDSRGANR